MRAYYLSLFIILLLVSSLFSFEKGDRGGKRDRRERVKEHFIKKRMGKKRDKHIKKLEPQILEFIKKDSAFYKDMLKLKEIDRHLYHNTLRKVNRLDNMDFNEVDDIEELFTLSKVVVKQRVLIEDYLENRLSKDEVKGTLTQLLNKEFDIKESLRKRWIENMESRVKKQRALIDERGKKRDQIIEYRMDEILDGNFRDNEW